MSLILDPRDLSPALSAVLDPLIKSILQHYDWNFADNTDDVVSKIASLLEAPETDELFKTLKQNGLSFGTVKAFLNVLKTIDIEVPGASDAEKIVTLLKQPVSVLSDKVEWPLIGLEPKDNTFNTSQLVLNGTFTGSANFGVSASLAAQFNNSVDALEGKSAQHQNILSYTLTGKAMAGAQAGFSAPVGAAVLNASAGGSASVAGEISLYSHSDADTSLLKALYNDFCAFDDIPGLQAFATGDIQAMSVEYKGALTAFAEVGLGITHTVSHSKLTSSLQTVPVIEAGISVGAQVALSGHFDLLTYVRSSDKKLVLEINKSRKSESSRSLSVSANVSLPGISNTAKTYLKKINDYDDKLTSFLDKFADPKALLQEKLREAIADYPSWQQDLIGLAIGAENDEDLKKALEEKLTEELDQAFVKFDELLASNGLDELSLKQLAARLGLQADPDALAPLQEIIRDTLDKVQESFKEDVLELAKTNADKVLGPIKAFGLKVDSALNDLNTMTAEVLAPIHAFRKHYQTKLKVIGDFLNNTLVEEVGFAYSRVASTSDENSAVVKIAFDIQDVTHREAASKYLAQCLGGDFSGVLKDIKNNTISNFASLEDSVFTSVLTNNLTTSLSINLFGAKATVQDILSEKARIVYDGHGQLSVYQGEAEFQQLNQSKSEYNKIVVTNVFDLLSNVENKVSVNYEYGDDALQPDELVGFMSTFETLGMLKSGTSAAAIESLQRQGLFNGKQGDLAVQLSLPVNVDDILQAADSDPEVVKKKTFDCYCRAIEQYTLLHSPGYISIAYDVIKRFEPGKSFTDNMTTLASMSSIQTKKAIDKIFKHYGLPAKHKTNTRKVIRTAEDAAENMYDYLTTFKSLSVQSVPAHADQIELQKAKQALTATLRSINNELDEMISGTISMFGKGIEKVHPYSVGFVSALSAVTVEEPFIPVIYRKKEQGLPVPVVISR